MFGNTGFGNQTGGLFGNKTFGTTTTAQSSLFGTPTTTTTSSLFGQQRSIFSTGTSTSNLFGTNALTTGFAHQQQQQQQQPSIFGSNSFTSSTANGTTIKFDPLKGTDTMMRNNETKTISTKHMCITAMKQYENKSLEELRVDDYLANRKAPASGASTSLFSQNTTSGTGLFGQSSGSSIFSGTSKPAFGATSTAPSLFGSTTTTTQSGSLFGPPKSTGAFSFNTGNAFATQPAGAGPFVAKPTGSLFGPTQPQQQSSLFGPSTQQPAFGVPVTTSSMFSFPSSAAPTTNAFGTSTTAPANNFSFNQQPPGGMFGKPAASLPFGSGFNSTSNSGFGTGSTNMFGTSTAQKSNIFGTQTTSSLSFGNAATAAAPNLFGGAQAQQQAAPSLFNSIPTGFQTGAQAAAVPTYQSPPAQPIILGADVNEVALQQAIIDAQISSLPYGDSPLLKMSTTVSGESLLSTESPTNLQRQMRFLASKTAEKKGISLLTHDSSVLLRSPLASARLDTSRQTPNESFTYKPILSLPSLGFASTNKASLNSTESPSKSIMSRSEDSILSKSSQTNNKKSNVKVLDVSVLRKPAIESSVLLNETREENQHTFPSSILQTRVYPERQQIGTPPVLNLDQSSPGVSENSEILVEQQTTTVARINIKTVTNGHLSKISPISDRLSDTEKNSSVMLSRPEYYVEPSLSSLNEATMDNVCRINNGLTIGRLGFGSVFWPGTFELTNLNFDEIVHFRHKEVVVYPDESTKPEVGHELNRPAEVSLERVWPTDKQTRENIKDPEELARMGFRERLERHCIQMSARFIDYQPATGTWCFAVSHFSKYGYIEESDDEELQMTVADIELLKQQRDKQFLIQRAKMSLHAIQPLNEKYTIDDQTLNYPKLQEGFGGVSLKIELQDDTLDSKIYFPHIDDTINSFGKRIKLDEDLMDESKNWLQIVATSAMKKKCLEKPKQKLIEKTAANKFVRAISPRRSILGMLSFKHSKTDYLHKNSCKIRWSKELAFVGGGFSSDIYVAHVESYLKQVLVEKDCENEYERIIESGLFRLNPPSIFLRLIDSYLVYLKSTNKHDVSIDYRIKELFRTLLISQHTRSDIERRMRLCKWLRNELEPQCEQAQNNANGPCNPFFKIFVCLIFGKLQDAINTAKLYRLFHLQMLISLFISNCPQAIRTQIAEQIRSYDSIYPVQKIDRYLEKVLLLLSGSCAYTHGQVQTVVSCVEGLNWLQILFIICNFWASPSTTLTDCINLYDSLLENHHIETTQEYGNTSRI